MNMQGNGHYRSSYLEQQPLVGEEGGLAEAAVAIQRKRRKAQPVRRRKVDRLRAVEPRVEPAVVRARERDHKLARLLLTQTKLSCMPCV